MAHRNRAEQRAYKARKDPKGRAKPVRVHLVKTTLDLESARAIEEMQYEVDQYFAEYAEPDPDYYDED